MAEWLTRGPWEPVDRKVRMGSNPIPGAILSVNSMLEVDAKWKTSKKNSTCWGDLSGQNRYWCYSWKASCLGQIGRCGLQSCCLGRWWFCCRRHEACQVPGELPFRQPSAVLVEAYWSRFSLLAEILQQRLDKQQSATCSSIKNY